MRTSARQRAAAARAAAVKAVAVGVGGTSRLTTRTSNTSWEERFDELTKYKAKHGDCKVPESQGPLGKWVKRQRAARMDGKLSEEHVQKLDDIVFNWGTTRGTQPRRDERFDELMGYKSEHGVIPSPHPKLTLPGAGQKLSELRGGAQLGWEASDFMTPRRDPRLNDIPSTRHSVSCRSQVLGQTDSFGGLRLDLNEILDGYSQDENYGAPAGMTVVDILLPSQLPEINVSGATNDDVFITILSVSQFGNLAQQLQPGEIFSFVE